MPKKSGSSGMLGAAGRGGPAGEPTYNLQYCSHFSHNAKGQNTDVPRGGAEGNARAPEGEGEVTRFVWSRADRQVILERMGIISSPLNEGLCARVWQAHHFQSV